MGDCEMTDKRLAIFSPALLALYQPLLAFAQQTQQQSHDDSCASGCQSSHQV